MAKLLEYLQSVICMGCDKEKECVVLQCEAFTGPHCAKCLFREMKKRSQGNKQRPMDPTTDELFHRNNAPVS